MEEVNHHPRRRPGSYYAVLGVSTDASLREIRSAYRKLAMKWHPDRWWTKPWLVDEANSRFKEIQEAWEVLSDQGKRALYDAGLYDPLGEEADEEEIEGFSGFLQEMMALMDNVRREGKEYSLEELQSMLAEMAGGFESTPPPQPPSTAASAPRWFDTEEETSRASKRFRGDRDRTDGRRSRGHVVGVELWESTSCYSEQFSPRNFFVSMN